MKAKITFMKSKLHFIFNVMLFTVLFFFQDAYSQKVKSILTEKWSTDSYGNDLMVIYTYDSSNYLTNSLQQVWNGNSWEDFTQIVYSNNTNGTINYSISQSWDSNTATWINSQRTTYSYDANDKILTAISDYFLNGSWVSGTKLTNTYDTYGFLTNGLTQTYIDSTTLVNAFQTNYTNNANGTVNFEIHQSWDMTTSTWKNTQKITYTYGINGQLSNTLLQNWDVSVTPNDWKDAFKTDFAYNNDGTVHQSVSESWDNSQLIWVNDSRSTYNYGELGVNDFKADKLFTIYPIPVSENLMIKTNYNVVQLPYTISDQNGRKLFSGVLNTQEVAIDANQLTSGVYFIGIGENMNQSIKFLKN